MAITLSTAIMTHNEVTELGWLMDVLKPFQNADSEIVVLDDFSDAATVDLIKKSGAKFYQRALNKNFSAQRNYLKNLCQGEFIFLLDPDEIPPFELLQALPKIIEKMRANNIDACTVPRLNILVDGDKPVDARTLTLIQSNLHNSKRDDQTRIIRNAPQIKWVNRVHERLVGVERLGLLPQELRFALRHCKTRQRQEGQNSFYRGITLRYLDKWRKSIAKRLGLIKQPTMIELSL